MGALKGVPGAFNIYEEILGIFTLFISWCMFAFIILNIRSILV